jgi:hypothetical protein
MKEPIKGITSGSPRSPNSAASSESDFLDRVRTAIRRGVRFWEISELIDDAQDDLTSRLAAQGNIGAFSQLLLIHLLRSIIGAQVLELRRASNQLSHGNILLEATLLLPNDLPEMRIFSDPKLVEMIKHYEKTNKAIIDERTGLAAATALIASNIAHAKGHRGYSVEYFEILAGLNQWISDKREGSRQPIAPQQTNPPVMPDATLARLQRKYNELLVTIDLPDTGFTKRSQARAASLLSTTYQRLAKRMAGARLEPPEKDARVFKAEKLKSAYYRDNPLDKARTLRRSLTGPPQNKPG